MNTQILTDLSPQEFKELLKEALKEILSEQLDATKHQLPDVFDIKEAAKFLKLKISTLYEKTSRKQIPHFKKGNKLYFYFSELQTWIKQGKVKTHSETESEALTYTLNNKIHHTS